MSAEPPADRAPEDARPEERPVILGSLPWAVTLFAFLLVVIKVVSVSHGSVTTALGLVQASGIAEVILGTFVVTFPNYLVFVFVAVLAVINGVEAPAGERVLLKSSALIVGLVLMFFAWIPYFFVVPVMLDFVLGGPISRWRWERSKGVQDAKERRSKALDEVRRLKEAGDDVGAFGASSRALEEDDKYMEELGRHVERSRQKFYVGAAIFAVLGLLQIVTDEPWVPLQRVTLEDDRRVTGYTVTSPAETGAVLLRESDRKLIPIEPADVKSQEMCQSSPNLIEFSLFDFFLPNEPDYAECD